MISARDVCCCGPVHLVIDAPAPQLPQVDGASEGGEGPLGKQDDEDSESALEPPASARSWALPSMVALMNRPGVVQVSFDQCRLGLRDLEGKPLRKRTSLATNSPILARTFEGFRCNCTTPHGLIQGSQHGVKMSVFAHRYPHGDAACPPGGPLRGPGA